MQQTRVKTVIPYFERFIIRFPDVNTLAKTHLDEVLHHWSGLGYYARGRNLHNAARIIVNDLKGEFPETIDKLISLPGIGRSTAGAILALSLDQRQLILDGNVKRVLTRYQGISGWPGDKNVNERLWALAEELTPKKHVANYTQAMMDLGATVCTRTRPDCVQCPINKTCYACVNELQSELPSKRKNKKLPVKQTIFTIIENNQGEVLLERRPPVGIWGGLWSFPECPVHEDISQWIKDRYGSTVSAVIEQSPLRHTFSHFHLDIRPVRAKVMADNNSIQDKGDLCWYNPQDKTALGMAAPVMKLLQTI